MYISFDIYGYGISALVITLFKRFCYFKKFCYITPNFDPLLAFYIELVSHKHVEKCIPKISASS